MEIEKFNSGDHALDAASIAFEKLLEKSFNLYEKKGTETLLLVSGGSSLLLLDRVSDTYLGKYLTITMLDERFSTDSRINNFAQLSETQFYSWAQDAGCNFIDTRIKESDSLQEAAESFERRLRTWTDANPDGRIIATVGMGANGHVAGIMPYPENKELFEEMFDNKRKWVVGFDAGEKDKYGKRITTTLPFIRMIDSAIAFVAGQEKRDAFMKLTAEDGLINETPVRIVRKIESVRIFTNIYI